MSPAESGSNAMSITGMVCGVVALVFLPIVMGPVGVVLGFVARSRGERLSTVAVLVAVLGTVIGVWLGLSAVKGGN